MTLKELSQLYYLNREIEMDKKRLLELEARAVSCSSDLSGMSRSSGVGDRVGRYAAEIVDFKGIIEAKLQQCIYERNRESQPWRCDHYSPECAHNRRQLYDGRCATNTMCFRFHGHKRPSRFLRTVLEDTRVPTPPRSKSDENHKRAS